MTTDVGIQPAKPPLRQALRHERIPLAIGCMVASGIVFACSSAASKWLVATYPVGEVLFTRTLSSLVALGLFILPAAGLSVYRTQRLGAHVIRAGSQACSQSLLLVAFMLMPLAGATAITFSSPLFTVLASAYFLHEKVGATRLIVLLVGFLGVLIITGPGADLFQVGAVFALASAILFGTVVAGVRGMTATESTATLTMYQLTILTGVYALTLPFGFVMPNWTDAGIMAISGLGNGMAQYWWTRAIHLAPTSAVVPFQYLSLVWTIILGFAVWGDVPTAGLLIGSAIVIASGMVLFWREARRVPIEAEP